jgi:hypothetical protein
MSESITPKTLQDMADRGAFRLTLKDGRSFVIPGPGWFCVHPRGRPLILLTDADGQVVTELARVERAEPVWPDDIRLAD